jgi:hypothetical protein
MFEDDRNLTPSATGILQCLRVLAQEAATLQLFRTLSAIEDALEAAAFESSSDTMEDCPLPLSKRTILH